MRSGPSPGSVLFRTGRLGYPPRTVTLMKHLGLGLCVVLCAATAAGQASQPGPENEQPAGQHVPNHEAVSAYLAGQAAYERKDMVNAAQAFESAVKIDPEFAAAWGGLGNARLSLHQPAQAEAAFRKVVE